VKNYKFSGLNANGLEIKLQIQQGMAFLILTFIFIMAAKKLNFYVCSQKTELFW